MRRTRVVIADRHPVTLEGLSSVLRAQRDFKIVALCRDGASCVRAIQVFMPDIAIVDISMPDVAGLQTLAVARAAGTSTRLVFFASSFQESDFAAAGAHAVISKDAELDTLVQILRHVANGQRFLQLPLAHTTIGQRSAISEKALTALTDRERQIARMVSEGLSNKEIGRRLSITDGTIKVHLHHIFQKLDIGNRTALAALAVSQNDNLTSSLGDHDDGKQSRRRHHHP
ncbi:response regulator transcription factor [Bradyrhizobium sp. STM 3843]|uniref:LuxR C-terminal-related transcriptional regulator n=1 Tax=Bradyrhizobium sp. STM 3843 TaxID=551947 RepID=UPI0003038D16|nr:response regulator transcription factor [Bradyrhizobium sp. STM 3843]